MQPLDAKRPKGDPDPYPNYAWLREKAPVSAMFSPHGIGGTWLVTSYEIARTALADPRLSNDSRNSGEQVSAEAAEDDDTARGLLDLDRPEHARLRKLVNGSFSPTAVTRWRPMMERICHAAIDRIAEQGEADLVGSFALPVPVAIIHEVLGVPEDQRKDPARCFDLFYRAGLARPPDASLYRELIAYVDHFIDYKQRNRGDDITSMLLDQLDAGELYDERELRSMLLGVLGAGHVTTVQFFGCAILRLLANTDQLAALLAGDTGWASGVNEMLRIDSPIQATVYRYATEDLELGGVRIARGDAVLISLAAANRDPARFDRPDLFDADRASRSNLAFGHGAHLCLGAHLARLEGEIGLDILFRRLPDLRLAIPPDDVVFAYGPMLRGPRQVPVSFTARRIGG
nr:cytochrome P450 [Kibdelosporangium sp. MJ126-NF4]CEL12862.1 putative cytochrome P450 hydroxylase [Kibdelosporangium sp. MJ126-NF4]CTQ98548.1 putative cytochrome P450 hydroxylase [Kibdelosporangium sp. MJ126-NF4]